MFATLDTLADDNNALAEEKPVVESGMGDWDPGEIKCINHAYP